MMRFLTIGQKVANAVCSGFDMSFSLVGSDLVYYVQSLD